MEIGERIKLKREELNMSQDELAKKVGYKSRSSVNKIESDGRGLPQNKIVLFANALQTTPAYLMGWENENEMHQAELSLQDQQAYAIDTLYSAFGEEYRDLRSGCRLQIQFLSVHLPQACSTCFRYSFLLSDILADVLVYAV